MTQCVMLLLSPENIKVPILVQNVSCDYAGRSILICFFPIMEQSLHTTKKKWKHNEAVEIIFIVHSRINAF